MRKRDVRIGSIVRVWLTGLVLGWLTLAIPALWVAKDGVGAALPWPLEPLFLRLQRPLEQRFQRAVLHPSDHIAGIVVLGGHIARAREAARLGRRYPEARIVLTGGQPDEKEVLLGQGFSLDRIVIDRDATSTYDNALAVAGLAILQPRERWLLVTSALHMPRAMGTFDMQALTVEAWPVYDTHSEPRYVAPVVLRECVGLLAYWVQSKTRTIFPGPSLSAIDRSVGR